MMAETATRTVPKWRIVVEPQGANPTGNLPPDHKDGDEAANEGGMVILLAGDIGKHEVSRVAFVRRNSKNPDVEFADQLEAEMAKAKRALEIIEQELTGDGELV